MRALFLAIALGLCLGLAPQPAECQWGCVPTPCPCISSWCTCVTTTENPAGFCADTGGLTD